MSDKKVRALKKAKIYVAGHRGMVGGAILRRLRAEGYENIALSSSAQTDLRSQAAVNEFFAREKPEYVFLAAAKVGGIMANNTYRADFLYDNLMIQNNVISAAKEFGIKKLLFLGSSCIYPKMAPQPLREDSLLTGVLEQTNEPYAIAKIAGIKLCEAYRDQYGCNFISVMPTNLYGPGDNYDLEKSHVLPALLRKFMLARFFETGDLEAVQKDFASRPVGGKLHLGISAEKCRELAADFGIKTEKDRVSVEIWGTGQPMREFLHVDDLADACLFLMENYDEKPFLNVGTGKDLRIAELAEMVKKISGFTGEIYFNSDKPDGTPRKYLDVSRLKDLNWSAQTELQDGIRAVYRELLSSVSAE